MKKEKIMSKITIANLQQSRELDDADMAAVRGGNSWLSGLGPIAQVNVGINQNITQLQSVDVNTLNNVGVIGAGFALPAIDVSPSQWANTAVSL
jgi:hypothetical protein